MSTARASVDYLLREVPRWEWMPPQHREFVLSYYGERRKRLRVESEASDGADETVRPQSPPTVPAPAQPHDGADETVRPEAPLLPTEAAQPHDAPEPTVVESAHRTTSAPTDGEWGTSQAGTAARQPRQLGRGITRFEHGSSGSTSTSSESSIRWFHALGALLLVAAGIGFLRSNWDAWGSIFVTFGLLTVPVFAFLAALSLRDSLPDSSRGLSVLGGVTLPSGLLALQLYGFVTIAFSSWAFFVFLTTAVVLAGLAWVLVETACVYLSALAVVLSGVVLAWNVQGAFGYPLIVCAAIVTWAIRPDRVGALVGEEAPRSVRLLEIHSISLAYALARVALVASLTGGSTPGVHSVVVAMLSTAFFVGCALRDRTAEMIVHAFAACGLAWGLAWLRQMGGHGTLEAFVEQVLMPGTAACALAARQIAVRVDRMAATPIVGMTGLLSAATLVLACFAGLESARPSAALLMAAVEVGILAPMFYGWLAFELDVGPVMTVMAALGGLLGPARLLPEVSPLQPIMWALVFEVALFLVVALAVDRHLGRAQAAFPSGLALALGHLLPPVFIMAALAEQWRNLSAGTLVVTVLAVVFEPFFRGWSTPSPQAVLPLDGASERDDAWNRFLQLRAEAKKEATWSISRRLAYFATLLAPVSVACLVHVEVSGAGARSAAAPFSAAVLVSIALLALSRLSREGADHDVHWRQALDVGSVVAVLWGGALAALWVVPGPSLSALALVSAAAVCAIHAAGRGRLPLAHAAYAFVQILICANAPHPVAVEWISIPLGLWMLLFTLRLSPDRGRLQGVAVAVLGLPSLLGAALDGWSLHAPWAAAVGLAVFVAGHITAHRGRVSQGGVLLAALSVIASFRWSDATIGLVVVGVLTGLSERVFRVPGADGDAGTGGADLAGSDGVVLRTSAAELAVLSVACMAAAAASLGWTHVAPAYSAPDVYARG
ncbi:MAG: hypothetical protein EB084_20385, partial [Proteobacteria bacterium]|nr:hypothetical protein [Pseudomonadota bacterium]